MHQVRFNKVESREDFDELTVNPFEFYMVPSNPEPSVNGIYGVEWNGSSSPIWTRTDDSVGIQQPVASFNGSQGSSFFDDIYPWSEMQIVEDNEAGTLVSIPKFYYKWTINGSYIKLQISGTEFDGSFVSPAHMDRNDGKGERDVVYVGRYYSNIGNLKSESGHSSCEIDPWNTVKSSIHNLGSDIWLWDYPMYWTICMLYLVEYATWDSRNVIGTPVSSRTINTGGTSSMSYHTGNTGNNTGLIQYRHIENLWSGAWSQFIDGIYVYNQQVWIAHNPYNSSYVSIGNKPYIQNNTSIGIITSFIQSQVSGYEYALIPYTFDKDASNNEYVCDYVSYNNSTSILMVGNYGLFGVDFTISSSARSANFTARLMKL